MTRIYKIISQGETKGKHCLFKRPTKLADFCKTKKKTITFGIKAVMEAPLRVARPWERGMGGGVAHSFLRMDLKAGINNRELSPKGYYVY